MLKKTVFVFICLIPFSGMARDVVNLDDQIIDATTGEQLILAPKNNVPLVDLNTLVSNTNNQTSVIPNTSELPNIELSTEIVPQQIESPVIKHWTCNHGKCNPIELLIFNSQNATLIGLDNQLYDGWLFLSQKYPNLPILQTRNSWVSQRDTLATQILGQHGNEITIQWLIQQYKARIHQLDQLGLIPKK